MNRHESYKKSEIDWVGEIPSHWETVKPKYRLNRVTRPIEDGDEKELAPLASVLFVTTYCN